MSVSEKTPSEVADSLNGFDEIAIKKEFGSTVEQLGENSPMSFLRALVFIEQRRGGLRDSEAYKTAMNLPLGEIRDYFTPEAEEDEVGDELGEANGSQ